MNSNDIRKKFLEYFKQQKHQIEPSSSLIPDDPTMLLTTAGMVQFKPFFLSLVKPKNTRITTVQKCVRTTDVEQVGHTPRHHTFFEMLGNFSFGDYYKKEAIIWGWELLTKGYKLDKSRMYVTIFHNDEEAYKIWKDDIGLPDERILRLGEDSNFWSAGPTGPCGPSSEIMWDMGAELACSKNCLPGVCDCDRWLEVWNLVFMQYDRDEEKKLTELPKKNIDTGMGLERLASVLQGVKTNFETDLFMPIISTISKLSGSKLGSDKKKDISIKVIADHSRALTFMINDGVLPSNEGRGYVLRRLIRRTVRHGRLLGIKGLFLNDLVDEVIALMNNTYPDLQTNKTYIRQIVENEEDKFSHTLKQGTAILEEQIKVSKKEKKKMLCGQIVYKLYDTYGFPMELTSEIAKESGLAVNEKEFDKLMGAQKEKARAAWKDETGSKEAYAQALEKAGATAFTGYEELTADTKVKVIIQDGKINKKAKAGQEVEIVLEKTPFYAEKGGQVGDTGIIQNTKTKIEIVDTLNPIDELVTHKGKVVKGEISSGDSVQAVVLGNRRRAIARAHTATHLLHWSLRSVLGEHVKQGGSLVSEDKLRFDFTHFQALTDKEISEVESKVNKMILEGLPVRCYTTTLEYAKQSGAMALFGEKYGNFVRLVEAGDISKELCGGTHLSNTAKIGMFKITSESSVGASLRRIEAICGQKAMQLVNDQENTLSSLAAMFKVAPAELEKKAQAVLNELSQKDSQINKLKRGSAGQEIEDLVRKAQSVGSSKLIVTTVNEADMDTLRQYCDVLRNKLGSSIVLLISAVCGRVLIVAAATKDLVEKGFDSGKWLAKVAPVVGGSGGGRSGLAQAGGKDTKKIPEALKAAEDYVIKWSKGKGQGTA